MCPLLPSASGHPHLLEMDFAPHVDLVSVVGLKVAFVTWQITTTVFTGYRLSANDSNLVCVSPSLPLLGALLNKELDFTCCVLGSPLNISSA